MIKDFITIAGLALVTTFILGTCTSAISQEIECRTRWKPSLYKTSIYCVRYRGELWLCPVETCRRKR